MSPRLGDLVEEGPEFVYAEYRIYRLAWARERAQELEDAGIAARIVPTANPNEFWEVGDRKVSKSNWYEIWVPRGKVDTAWLVWRGDFVEDQEVIDGFMEVHHAYVDWSNTFRHKTLPEQKEFDARKERALMILKAKVRELHEVLNG